MMTPKSYALIETMPEHLRESHRAANNWGVYPHNGAVRVWAPIELAEIAVDGDEYDHIVETKDSLEEKGLSIEEFDGSLVLRDTADGHSIWRPEASTTLEWALWVSYANGYGEWCD